MSERDSLTAGGFAYLSILFAPIIVPLIILFSSEDEKKEYAKKAFLAHVLVFILILFTYITTNFMFTTTIVGGEYNFLMFMYLGVMIVIVPAIIGSIGLCVVLGIRLLLKRKKISHDSNRLENKQVVIAENGEQDVDEYDDL